MWNKDQHPEKKEIPGASSLAAGDFFLLGADKTRSVYMSLAADGAGTRESSFRLRTGPCQRGVETGLNVPQQVTGSARSESLRVAERGRDAGIQLPAPHGAVPAEEKKRG